VRVLLERGILATRSGFALDIVGTTVWFVLEP